MSRLLQAAAAPVVDVYRGLDRCLAAGWSGLLRVVAGLLLGWWIYVPWHELLHALGCWASGGQVGRLEIAELYGGKVLAHYFSFVEAGGEYAGRLADFDTGGSDVIYLATDLAPFLLTLWPGVWLLRRMARGGRPLFFGGALPFALAPFLSLTGDAYEIGSILVTRLPPWQALSEVLRGDDIAKVAMGLAAAGPVAWTGWVMAGVLGAVWAWLSWRLGSAVAGRFAQPSLEAFMPPTAELE